MGDSDFAEQCVDIENRHNGRIRERAIDYIRAFECELKKRTEL